MASLHWLVRFGELRDWCDLLNTGVIEADIQPAKVSNCLVDQMPDLILLRHVGPDEAGFAAC
jgi:hypothetical protein